MEKQVGLTRAIIALILNIVLWPGLGSVVGGRIKVGIIQMVTYIIAVFMFAIPITVSAIVDISTVYSIVAIVGVVAMITIFIWGIITGVKIIKESKQ